MSASFSSSSWSLSSLSPFCVPVVLAEEEGWCVVMVDADLEEPQDLDLLEMALCAAARTGKRVMVDLSMVDFFSSGVLDALLGAGRRGQDPLWLAGPLSPSTLRRLELTATTGLFHLTASLREALAPDTGQSAPNTP
ncbi:hypothetical protein [Kitasatospora sp. NPDC088783]|uniref:hypothetical protein n=1 Tax=Kitasatospora sp. NPDC088783 TaxID=3364077 RepID=UPI0037FDC5FE